MKRFKKILVYLGEISDSDPALQRAFELAKHNDGALKIVCSLEEVPGFVRGLLPSKWDVQALVRRDIEEKLERIVKPLREGGLEVTAGVLVGRPALEITREVLRNQHDLVMKTAQGEEAFLGTVAHRLMRMCPCPVWVIDRANKGRFRRILAAVDPDPDRPQRDALNVKILELATSLGESEGAEVHVFHAWTVYGEVLLDGRVSPAELSDYVGAAQREAASRLRKLLSKVAATVPEKHTHLRKGLAEEEIPRLARQREIDLIVMGTVGRTGITGFVMGNTAERILRKVECSLLTVKPDEFVSPVAVDE